MKFRSDHVFEIWGGPFGYIVERVVHSRFCYFTRLGPLALRHSHESSVVHPWPFSEMRRDILERDLLNTEPCEECLLVCLTESVLSIRSFCCREGTSARFLPCAYSDRVLYSSRVTEDHFCLDPRGFVSLIEDQTFYILSMGPCS